jgi:glycosyltransferase involved in cell wall biosynthesis
MANEQRVCLGNKQDDLLAIGTAARLVPQKSIHVLLYAFAEFLKLSPQRSRLFIAGEGPLHDELTVLADRIGIRSAVCWLGNVEDIPCYFASLDIFVLTSAYEGLGRVLLEAMAARLPVVATKASAIPEIVIDGVTGSLCVPNDPQSFAQALVELATRPDRRIEMGEQGLERIKSMFTLHRMHAETMEIYNS